MNGILLPVGMKDRDGINFLYRVGTRYCTILTPHWVSEPNEGTLDNQKPLTGWRYACLMDKHWLYLPTRC